MTKNKKEKQKEQEKKQQKELPKINIKETEKHKNNLIKQQTKTTKELNNLLNKTNNIISCGPECQRTKILDDLYSKYINSETNLKTAPSVYENSRKNYYVYKEGSNYYNDLLEKELNTKAENIAINLDNEFNKQIKSSKALNTLYESSVLNSEANFEYYNSLLKENDDLIKNLKEKKINILVNDRKTYYEDNEYEKLKRNYYYWKILYYILLLIFILASLLTKTEIGRRIGIATETELGISNFKLFLIFILLLFIPYILNILIYIIKKIYHYIKIRTPINVYNNI